MKFKVGSSSSFVKRSVGTNTLQHKNQVSIDDLVAIGKPIVALIDQDIVNYRCSAATDGRKYTVSGSQLFDYKKDAVAYCIENDLDPKTEIVQSFHPEDPSYAHKGIEKTLKAIKVALKAHKLELYMTPDVLFRSEYMSDYKANRKGLRKPANLQSCKDFAVNNYYAEMVDGYEADDLLAIRARQLIQEGEYTPVICSLDKDLDTVSCYHYQWTKKCIYFVSPNEGTLFFYKQLLMGDATDNIPGIKGVGPKTADVILEGLDGSSGFDCYVTVLKAYLERTERLEEKDDNDGNVISTESDEDFSKRVVTTVTRNARMLYILHQLGEVWYPPVATTGTETV